MSTLVVMGTIATAAIAAIIVFFSAAVAPLVFVELEKDAAGRFLRAFFPRYYAAIILLAIAGAGAFASTYEVATVVLAAVAFTGFVSRQYLMPRVNSARDAWLAGDSIAKRHFDHLHRASVLINVAQLLAVLAILVAVTALP